MGHGGWGSWHQAVTLVESQYMNDAFFPHLQSHILALASFPKESIHFMTFPLLSLLQPFSLLLTSRQHALN